MTTNSSPKYKTFGRTAKPGCRPEAFRDQPVCDVSLETTEVKLDFKSHYSTIEIEEYIAAVSRHIRSQQQRENRTGRVSREERTKNIQESTPCKWTQPGQEPEPKGALVAMPEALAQSPGCQAHRCGQTPRGSQGPRWEEGTGREGESGLSRAWR